MIIDIIYLPFKGEVLPEYNASTPIVISDHPHTIDDIYMMGYCTNKPIHKSLFRYKIIESINGALYEHICITQSMLNLDNTIASKDIPLYIISTKVICGDDVQTFRYHKTISYLLSVLDSYYSKGLTSVHQVAIQALLQMQQNTSSISEIELLLSGYVTPRHKLLCNITTASISDAISVMVGVRDIYDSVQRMMSDSNISSNEIYRYLDMSLNIPRLPVQNGICGLLINRSIGVKVHFGNIIPMLQGGSLGKYRSFLPPQDIYPVEGCETVNAHLYEGVNGTIPTGLIEILTNLELCGYTDLSIEIPYTTNDIMPSYNIHYSGSIFNNYDIGIPASIPGINIHEIFNVAVAIYGNDEYDVYTPSIHICKTFAEEIYIKFSSTKHKDIVHYFDLTIMALLSPIILDDTAAQFVYRQMYA